MSNDKSINDGASTSAQPEEEKVQDAVENVVNSSCLACKKDIHDGRSSSVQCARCCLWSHVKCTINKEVFDMLMKIAKKDCGRKKTMVFKGMVSYLCAGCQVFMQSNTTTNNVNSNPVFVTPPNPVTNDTQTVHNTAETCVQTASTSTQVSTTTKSQQVTLPVPAANESVSGDPIVPNNIQRTDQQKPQSQRPICYLYKQGKCPHGSSGNRVVNGQQCNYSHPRKCIKFCRFGQDINQGCTGLCDLLHPILCRNSVRYKRCLSENCTFAHLMGTERYSRQLNQNQYPSERQRMKYQGFSQPSNTINHGYPTNKSHEFTTSLNLDRRGNDGFFHGNSNFPPISQISQSTRMDQMSKSIRNIQQSIEFLMQNINSNLYNSTANQPCHNNAFQHGVNHQQHSNSSYQQSTYNNHYQPTPNNAQPTYNNQRQSNPNYRDQPFPTTQPRMEAKNY